MKMLRAFAVLAPLVVAAACTNTPTSPGGLLPDVWKAESGFTNGSGSFTGPTSTEGDAIGETNDPASGEQRGFTNGSGS
jgi:hypothetical protein